MSRCAMPVTISESDRQELERWGSHHRNPQFTAGKIEEIINATLQTRPPGATHWSSRTMAKAHGVSKATVNRIWQSHGLQPHRIEPFKLSRDPKFLAKLTDVVGLYLNPPEKA